MRAKSFLAALLAIACMLASSPTIVWCHEPAKPNADRKAKLAERDRLWADAQKLQAAGKNSDAITQGRAVIAIENELFLFGPNDKELISRWNLIGECAEAAEDWTAAVSAREEALRIAIVVFGANDWRTTDPRLAREQVMRLKGLSADDRRALWVASQANQEVVGLCDTGRYAAAEQIALRILGSRERILGPDHPDTATSLNNLAVLYQLQGNYAATEPLFQRALKIREKVLGSDYPDTAQSLNNLAFVYASQGNYAAAEPLYQRALKISEKVLGSDHPDTATSLNNLAGLHVFQGNYAAAEPLHQRAIKIREKTLGSDHPHTATSLNNLALLYTCQGNYAAAEPLYQRALKISEKTLGSEHPDTAINLNNLAELYRVQRNYSAAEPLYQRALKIKEKTLGPDHPETAASLNNLALLYTYQGNYAAAEPLDQRALKIKEKTLGPEHPDTATSLGNLAGLYHLRGSYAAAEPLYQRTLKIKEKALGRDHPDTAANFNNLGFLAWHRRQPEVAMPLVARGLGIQLRHLARTAAIQTEQQQLVMARDVVGHLDGWLTVTSGRQRQATEDWRWSLVWKGVITTRQLRLRQALKTDPLYDEYRQVSQQLSTLTLSPPVPPSDQRSLAAWNAKAPKLRLEWEQKKGKLEREHERLEHELSRKSAPFRQEKERSAVTPDVLQAALRNSSAPTALIDLVEYWYYGRKDEVSERRLAAFVVRGNGDVQRVELGPVAPIHTQLNSWREKYGRSRNNSDSGQELRRTLWIPLEPFLKGIDTVLISPDGVLAQLPWAALPGAKPDTFLIEERNLVVIPVPQLLPELLRQPRSTGILPELLEQPKQSGPPQSLLVVGDIDYGGDSGMPQELLAQRNALGRSRDGTFMQFRALPAAKAELASIEERYHSKFAAGKVRALQGSQGKEAAFRELAVQHQWLHVITHGYFAPEIIKSGLRANPDHKQFMLLSDERHKPALIHPGLLSGLAFAGANQPPESGKDDGILTALEVEVLDLSKVDTVVLSACETGLGEVAGGEGLLGLQRAFQIAGAKTVVASLWKVPDQATSILMQRFYENLWDKKMGKLEALRKAQLSLLKNEVPAAPDGRSRGLDLVPEHLADASNRLPPFYWAAFVLSGDWR